MYKIFEVRDRRDKGWFYMDNEYLNGYAKYFGAIGTAVYLSLCRHADAEQKCFPSQQLMAKELNVTTKTIRKYLNLLVKHRLISVKKHKNEESRQMNNVYFLLKRTYWTKPEVTVTHGSKTKAESNSRPKPEVNDDRNRGYQLPTKNTNRKNTNIRRERRIKNSEERINPIKKDISKRVARYK